jgi:hypothetical protein
MADLSPIDRVVSRARRRLRLQAALDAAISGAILAVALGLVALWLHRMRLVSDVAALAMAGGAGLLVAIFAIAGARRRWSDAYVATRVDRASALSDRLGSALDFAARLDDGSEAARHPDARGLMALAIEDGRRAAPRADVVAATPVRAPRDLGVLAAFVMVGAAISLLAFGPRVRLLDLTLASHAGTLANAALTGPDANEPGGVDPAEASLVRLELDDLRTAANAAHDEELVRVIDRLDGLVADAASGELSKEQLLRGVDRIVGDARPGSGRFADVTDAIRRLPPAPPPQPPPSPSPPHGVSRSPGPDPKPSKPGVNGHGNGIGHDYGGDPLGAETAQPKPTRDERVAGLHGDGPSRRETIRAAARHGFASTSYRQVYIEYTRVLEEGLTTQRVPQGYRTAVKRYFARIHSR